jgi:hypothetical protein
VLHGVSCGFADKEIAYRLGIKAKSVQHYVGLAIRELGFSNRVDIARWIWFEPEVVMRQPAFVDLHLPGCKCPHPRCVKMAAFGSPVDSTGAPAAPDIAA